MSHRGPQIVPAVTFEEENLGEAMRALNPGRRAFVHFRVHAGLSNADAALAAGYSAATAAMQGAQIAGHPAVQAAILEECRKVMRSEGPKSIATLVAIRDDTEATPRDRIKASELLLNRAGLHAISEHHETITHQLSDAEQDRRILALAAELGLSPDQAQKMLVAPADFEKNSAGVYEIVKEPKPEPSPQQQRNNARRRARRTMTPEEIEVDKATVRAEHADSLREEYAAHLLADLKDVL